MKKSYNTIRYEGNDIKEGVAQCLLFKCTIPTEVVKELIILEEEVGENFYTEYLDKNISKHSNLKKYLQRGTGCDLYETLVIYSKVMEEVYFNTIDDVSMNKEEFNEYSKIGFCHWQQRASFIDTNSGEIIYIL